MPAWAGKFLEHYAENGSVTNACLFAGISRQAHYQHMKETPCYKAAVEATEDAVGGKLEDLAVARVVAGESDTQMHLALLRRFRPQYRERSTVEVTGSLDLVDKLSQARERMIPPDADTYSKPC